MNTIRTGCLLIALLGCLPATAQQEPTGEIYTPLEQGQFQGSQRVGVWTYFDHPAEPSLIIDYTKGEVLYYKEDTASVVLLENGKKTLSRLARPCRFHGSYLPLFQHYMINVEVPMTLRSNALRDKEQIEAILTFEVGEEGIAKNPQVLGNPGLGVPKAFLKAFETAPNSWLAGMKPDGTPATCVLGVKLRVCVDSCQTTKSKEATIVYSFGNIVQSKSKRPNIFASLTNENQGIQYSPDNKKILVETTTLGQTAPTGYAHAPSGLVVDRETRQSFIIPFNNVNGCLWLDPDQIFFKYSIDLFPNLPAVYSVSTGKVKTIKDSTTYFNVISNDMSRRAYATALDQGSRISASTRPQGPFSPVYENPLTNYIPIGWSPKNDKLLITGTEDGLQQIAILDIASKIKTTIPLFSASVCGWSQDQKTLFLAKYDFQNFVGTLFSYNLETGLLNEIYAKARGLTVAIHSPEANQLALVMKGDAYLLPTNPMSEPVKIADGIYSLGWDRTGRYICLVGKKDKQLYEYDVKTKTTRKLTNWVIN